MSAAMKWILAIVGLLAANLIAMVCLVVASRSTRADVIPDYYERAAHYDDTIDQAARNKALGWQVEVSLARRELVVRVRDAHGAPIEGASVRVQGYARAHAGRPIDAILVEDRAASGATPSPMPASGTNTTTVSASGTNAPPLTPASDASATGTYRAILPIPAIGWHDLTIDIVRSDAHVVQHANFDASRRRTELAR